MPKVTIELDLPDGQSIPSAQAIKRLTDPNWYAEWWSVDDVKEYYLGDLKYTLLDTHEAQTVLSMMKKFFNPEVGNSWDTINGFQEVVVNMREEE